MRREVPAGARVSYSEGVRRIALPHAPDQTVERFVTFAMVKLPDGRLWRGRAICHPDDERSSARGCEIALGRALKLRSAWSWRGAPAPSQGIVEIHPRAGVSAGRVYDWLVGNFQVPGAADVVDGRPRMVLRGNPLVNAHIEIREELDA